MTAPCDKPDRDHDPWEPRSGEHSPRSNVQRAITKADIVEILRRLFGEDPYITGTRLVRMCPIAADILCERYDLTGDNPAFSFDDAEITDAAWNAMNEASKVITSQDERNGK